MSDQTRYEQLYPNRTLIEALRVIANLKGDEFVDDFVLKIFETQGFQERSFEDYDRFPPASYVDAAKAAVRNAVSKARLDPIPIA